MTPPEMTTSGIEGFAALAAKLESLGGSVFRRAMKKALRRGAAVVRESCRSETPVASGKLRRSIKVRANRARDKNSVSISVSTGTREELGISPQDTVYYPAVLEYGSRYIEPDDFMLRGFRKAYHSALDAIRGRLTDEYNRETEKRQDVGG